MLAWCVGVISAPAHAEEPSSPLIALSYEADPAVADCPSALEFQAILVKELGYDPCRGGGGLRLEVRIRPALTGIEGTIGWNDGKGRVLGERRFSSQQAQCRQMAASMGFASAVQLQLMATERVSALSSPGARGEPSSGGPVPSTSDISHQADDIRVRSGLRLSALGFRVRSAQAHQKQTNADWSSLLGVGLSLGVGLAPGPVGRGRVFASARYRWIGFELGAEATAKSTLRQDYGAGFQQQLKLGGTAACFWHESLAVCGLAKFGRIEAQGSGVDVPASPKGFMAQTGPRVSYQLELGRHLVVLGHLEVLWSVTDWAVELNRQTVWIMPPIAALVGFDVAARFP